MKYVNIKTVDKMVKKQNSRGNGRTPCTRTAWYSALLVLGTALLILTGCPETPADATPADQSDTTAPEPIAISNANLTVSPSSISLQWDPSPSDDVATVQVTWTPTHGEDQPKLIDIGSTETTITGLNAGVTYTFSITAIDTAGNVSSVAEVSATTPSAVLFTQAEYSFTDLDVAPGTTVGSVSATVASSAPADPPITLSYEIMQNDDDDGALFVIDSTTAEITIGAIALDPTRDDYSFTVQVTSSQGIIGTTTVVVSPMASAVDFAQDSYTFSGIRHTPGTTVGSVSATVAPADPSITLSYQIIENDDDDSASFIIDTATAEITIGATVLDPTRDDYSFTVQATSSQGVIVTTTVIVSPSLDTTAPDPVTEVDATTTAGTTTVSLSWINSMSTDVATIRIVWTETASGTGGGSHDITDVTTTRFDVTGLTSEVEYTFTLTALDDAVDAAGNLAPNESNPETDTATTPDTNAPSPVSSFTATPLAGGTEVMLSWINSDSVDAATLEIAWRSSTNGITPGSDTIASDMSASPYIVSGLTRVTPYTFTITVIDNVNNRSTARTVNATTLANPIDTDGDTLIDIGSLEQLHNMRYNLNGTSYKTSSGDGGALCGDDAATTCTGYELTRSLTFDDDGGGTYDQTTYVLDAGDHHATYFSVTGSGTGGWLPIGDATNPFSTIFEGNGFFVRGLAVRRNQEYIGMFGRTHSSAIIRNIRLTNNLADYTGSSGSNIYIGGLVAYNEGTISVGHAGAPADGGSGNNDRVGGLVGQNSGTITASYATGNTAGGNGAQDYVGGLVGQNNGSVIASYATGDADGGGGEDRVGGLVGWNSTGTIAASYATGDTDGGSGNNDRVGGLVGQNNGTIIASYATGRADDGGNSIVDRVGGLVGESRSTIIASYATGTADGGDGVADRVGGLVGESRSSIVASYATSIADGGAGNNDLVGSLLGFQIGSITASYGFGSTMNGELAGHDGSTDRDGHANFAVGRGVDGARFWLAPSATGFRAAPVVFDRAGNNTQNAWDFGTESQAPALRYADYDGGGGTYGCGSSSNATIVIPDSVPDGSGGSTNITCGSTLLGGPQPR